jgi:methionine-S-sulfoxide reductase
MNKFQSNAYFAGGCFWCVEHDLRSLDGVTDAFSGYAGPEVTGFVPTYENHKGFVESVCVVYDPEKISFKKLSQFFLDHIDPTDASGQFYDRGESYGTAIFYQNDEEKEIAESLVCELGESLVYDKPIVVRVLEKPMFYKAEEHHQNYAEKNKDHYKAYSLGSGRKQFQARVCEIRDQNRIHWKD